MLQENISLGNTKILCRPFLEKENSMSNTPLMFVNYLSNVYHIFIIIPLNWSFLHQRILKLFTTNNLIPIKGAFENRQIPWITSNLKKKKYLPPSDPQIHNFHGVAQGGVNTQYSEIPPVYQTQNREIHADLKDKFTRMWLSHAPSGWNRAQVKH